MVIHIDRIIENYLTDWIAGKDIPPLPFVWMSVSVSLSFSK